MTTTSLRSVRYAFTMFLLALTVFAVVESAFGGRTAGSAAVAAAPEGLSACGTAAEPCVLEPLTVVAAAPAEAAPVQLVADERTADCGTEAAPCVLPVVEVRAEASTGRLASTERSVGMTLRVRS
jgi:hypothetical protein